MQIGAIAPGAQPGVTGGKTDDQLRAAAQELEAQFLAEMLKSAGLGVTPDAFGGGEGEEQFASLLRQEQARMMVKAGGIGLAESIFKALQKAGADA